MKNVDTKNEANPIKKKANRKFLMVQRKDGLDYNLKRLKKIYRTKNESQIVRTVLNEKVIQLTSN